MATTFRLTTETCKLRDQFQNELTGDLTELQELYDEHPIRWRESDQGTMVSAWLEDIENVLDALDGLSDEPVE